MKEKCKRFALCNRPNEHDGPCSTERFPEDEESDESSEPNGVAEEDK